MDQREDRCCGSDAQSQGDYGSYGDAGGIAQLPHGFAEIRHTSNTAEAGNCYAQIRSKRGGGAAARPASAERNEAQNFLSGRAVGSGIDLDTILLRYDSSVRIRPVMRNSFWSYVLRKLGSVSIDLDSREGLA